MGFNPAEPRDKNGRWIHLAGLLKSAGGFTHSITSGNEPSSGFAVAVQGAEKKIKGHASHAAVASFVRKHWSSLTNDPKAHLGGWYNADDGYTYLDVSHVHGQFNDALKQAVKEKQIALFDLGSGNEFHTFIEDWQPKINAAKGHDLDGLAAKPQSVPGRGSFVFHSNKDIQGIASKYNRDHGLGDHPHDYSTVDPAKAALVAQAYDEMKHDPENPDVKAAYDALKTETKQQYEALIAAGYEYHFYPEGGDPYPDSPREAIYDLTQHKKMFVFPTIGADGGFGEDATKYPGHPLLETVPGLEWDGKPVTYNDLFRAVHDSMAHAKEGLGFGPRGEDNAYRQHSSMYGPLARKAIASETRGQNTWVNYGPHGEHNRTDPRHTVYAPQKAGLLPDWAIDPNFLKKKEATTDMSRSINTPEVHNTTVDLAHEEGRLAFWKQILPMKQIDYTAKDGSRQSLVFDKQYLTDLANNKAVDKVGFLLADVDNRHTMDPERWRGDVTQFEVRDDGLYGKIVFPNADAAKAVLDNPDLGVSARIREGVQRSDGSTVNRGIIHVLGTLDPQVSGMTPWEPTDLSTEQDDVLDLSEQEYKDMAKQDEKALADYTDAEIDAMSDEELDAFLAAHAPEALDYTESDEHDDDTDEVDDDEHDDNDNEDEQVLVGAGADMSNEQGKDIELANQRADAANARADEALRRVADAEWREARGAYLTAGVPAAAIDLAAEVLNRPDDMVIDLSFADEADVNVSKVVRDLLDQMKGMVDLSNEEGHNSHFTAGDGEDPDKAMLDRWNDQF